MKKIIIINGPNLNLLGKRQPEIYGNITFEDFFKELKSSFESIQLEYYQSNVEGDLVNKLQEVGFSYSGIVFNAGGYTHTSVAIADAVASFRFLNYRSAFPTCMHEEFRRQSLMAANCKGLLQDLD